MLPGTTIRRLTTNASIYEPVPGEYGAVVDAGPIYFGGYHCEGFFQ